MKLMEACSLERCLTYNRLVSKQPGGCLVQTENLPALIGTSCRWGNSATPVAWSTLAR